MRRMIAILTAAVLLLGTLSGCGEEAEPDKGEKQTGQAAAESDKTLTIATGKLTGQFSGFYPETASDKQVTDLMSVRLLDKDRQGNYILNGIRGETRGYKGVDYTYRGIADCRIKKRSDGKVIYDFTLRKDVRFSDGQPLTADDAIFSFYVYLDAAYDGKIETGQLPVSGLSAYRGVTRPLYKLMMERGKENTVFDVYTKKEQEQFFKKDWPKAQIGLIRQIMKHYQTKSVAKAMIALDYANKDESGRVNSNYTFQHWSMKGDDKPDEKDFLKELQFSANLEIVSENLVKNGVVEKGIFEQLPEKYQKTIQIGKTSANHIAGIRRGGKYKFSIILSKTTPDALDKLAIPIQPLHHYGNIKKYNYKKEKFGFNRGNLLDIKKKNKDPLGAGPYMLDAYKNNTARLKANPYYYRGKAKTENVSVVAMSENEMAYEITQKAVDIAEPSITKSDVLQLRKVNKNGTISGDVITTMLTDYPAYGYIGINAAKVCVGGVPESAESIYLRKAIAVVISYYRYPSVSRYYGQTAELLDYPIGRDSWASPQNWENSYEGIYDHDEKGRKFYTRRMDRQERTQAVKKGALDYFARAGYTIEKGKIKSAPVGAPESCTVLITGYGKKDHPSYRILQKAAGTLKELGFTLKISDEADSGSMFTKIQTGNAQMWCAAWPTEPDPDTYMYALHHSRGGSSYMYGIRSEKLDVLIEKGAKETDQKIRKQIYRKCLNYIRAMAVEIPVYQRQNCTLMGTARINMSTVPADETPNYNWRNEISNIQIE